MKPTITAQDFQTSAGPPFFTDTGKPGHKSLSLYAGVKQIKGGLEIQLYNQIDALDKLADAMERSYTRETLEERFAGSMQHAQERQRQVNEERGLVVNG